MRASIFLLFLRTYGSFYLHSRRFQVILAFYLVAPFMYALPFLANLAPRPASLQDYAYLPFSNFPTSVALPCALMAGDAISQDFSRQGYFTLTQPVRRSEVMLARYLAASVFSLVTMLAWFGSGSSGALALYGTELPNLGLMVLFTVLLVASMTAFVVLFSSIFKSPMLSLIVSVVTTVFLMPIIVGILEVMGLEPWPLITYAGTVVGALATATYPPHIQLHTTSPSLPVSVTLFTPYIWEATAIMTAYLGVSLGLAWLVYSRKEIKELA